MKSRQSGFSLVEILVALALVGLTGSAIMALVVNLNKYLRTVDNKSVEVALISSVSQTLSDKEQCRNALTAAGKQTINLTAPLKLSLSLPGAISVSEGVTYQNVITVREFYVDSFEAPVDSALAGHKKTVGTLWLKTEDVATSSVPRKKKNIALLNLVYRTSNNEIVECFSSGVSPDASCESLGFVWNAATSTCRQPAAASCVDLGGSWDGTKCVMPDTAKLANFLGKTCTGANQALVGFDLSGNPVCSAITAASGPMTSGVPAGVPAPATKLPGVPQCSGGSQTMQSNDKTNTCVFAWSTANAGDRINCSLGANCSAGGGTLEATCGDTGIWSYTFNCPDKGKTSCPGGTVTTQSSDKSNTCTFTWPMTSDGQTITPTVATNGGSLGGRCVGGVPSYSANCPGKTVTCPSGHIAVGKCYFAYGSGSPGSSPSYLYDERGIGTASGIKCQPSGVWDTSGVKINGC